MVEGKWTIPQTNQQIRGETDFDVELFATDTGKFVQIRPRATSFNPGSLVANNSKSRGYFSESVEIEIWTSGGGISLYDYEPKQTTASQEFSTSTGTTFGMESTGSDSPSVGISMSQSNSSQVTTSIPEWGIEDFSSGNTLNWRYKLMTVAGAPYYDWTDIYYTDFWSGHKYLHGLPASATNTVAPKFEALFRADASYTGNSIFYFMWSYEIRKSDVETDCSWFFTCENTTSTTSYTIYAYTSLSINFREVSDPADPNTNCFLLGANQGRHDCAVMVERTPYASTKDGVYVPSGYYNKHLLYEKQDDSNLHLFRRENGTWVIEAGVPDETWNATTYSANGGYWPWAGTWYQATRVNLTAKVQAAD